MSNKFMPALLGTAILGLSACTGAAPATPAPAGSASGGDSPALAGEITFQTWSLKNDKFTPYFEDLIDRFTTEHPETTVNWIDQPGDGYEEKLLQQANSNSLPDVVNLQGSYAYRLAEVGMLMDLKAADPAVLDTYINGGLAEYNFESLGVDGVYGYPWYQGSDVSWWNLELLQKAGKTEADLPTTNEELFAFAIDVAEQTNGEVKIISEAPKMGTLSNAGLKIFQDGKFVFNTPEAVKVIQMYKDAYAAGAMPTEALNGAYLGNIALFKEEKVAFTSAAAGFASELKSEVPTLLEKTAVTPRTGLPSLFGQGISVSSATKSPDVAVAFAQFVTNNENQVEFLKLAQGFFPGTLEANENPDSFTSVIELPQQKYAADVAAEAIKTAVNEYPTVANTAMDVFFGQQLALAVRGDIPIEEALQSAEDNANETLGS